LWEHVAGVVIGAVASAKTEGLTRRATGYQIEGGIKPGEVYAPNIALDDLQMLLFREFLRQNILVLAKCVATPFVVLNHKLGLEPRLS